MTTLTLRRHLGYPPFYRRARRVPTVRSVRGISIGIRRSRRHGRRTAQASLLAKLTCTALIALSLAAGTRLVMSASQRDSAASAVHAQGKRHDAVIAMTPSAQSPDNAKVVAMEPMAEEPTIDFGSLEGY
jgi:hypothetical protein